MSAPRATDTPTASQYAVLSYCVQMGGEAGTLGQDRRAYAACLRRGWIEEASVDRDFGLGQGVVMRLTTEGRHALDRAAFAVTLRP